MVLRPEESRSQTGLPDHISAAFVGGGSRWFVEVQFDDKSHLYLGGWVPTEGPVSDSWKTHFVRLELDLNHLEYPATTVTESREKIARVLRPLIDFTKRFEHIKNWADNFDNSLKTLTEFEPQASDDFIPSGIYSKEARQLIETAFRSWVFGGMGSWNDLAFNGEDHEQYGVLTGKLYEAVCIAIVSGVNSYT